MSQSPHGAAQTMASQLMTPTCGAFLLVLFALPQQICYRNNLFKVRLIHELYLHG